MAGGFFDGLLNATQSPLFLGGANLLMGAGPSGMMDGMKTGAGFQEMQRKRQMEEAQKGALGPLLGKMGMGQEDQAYVMANPEVAANILQGVYQNRFDPMADLKKRTAEANLAQANADLGMLPVERRYKEAQINALNQKDEINSVIANILKGAGTGAAPASPESPIIPQSYDGGTDPNLIRTAAGDAPQQQPNPQMVKTPMGMMPAEQAQRLGFALALGGKGEAGKMLYDPASGDLQKKTSADIEEKIMGSAAQLARLSDIQKSFDPKFLDIMNIAKMRGASWTSKLGGKLDANTTNDLQRFANFRSASVANLNSVLKEVSGAAVTPQEYERIQNDQPVAGTGIFDGDDPVSFQAKMQRATTSLKSAIARYNFMRTNKLNFDRNSLDKFMSLDDVPGVIDRRGHEIESKLRSANPRADPMSIERLTRQQIKQEFGI